MGGRPYISREFRQSKPQPGCTPSSTEAPALRKRFCALVPLIILTPCRTGRGVRVVWNLGEMGRLSLEMLKLLSSGSERRSSLLAPCGNQLVWIDSAAFERETWLRLSAGISCK